MLARVSGHLDAGLLAREAGPGAGVFDDAVLGEGRGQTRLDAERAIDGANDGADVDRVLAAEFEIAFVVGGHGHDGAGAVTHQNEVADPDRHLFAAVRIDGVAAGEEAFLFDIARVAAGARIHHRFGAGQAVRIEQFRVKRMFGREDDAGGAIDGIHAGSEDADLFAGRGQREIDLGAFGAADPIALHEQHALRPARFELAHTSEQFVGIRGDLEEPLFERALLDGGIVMTPAAAFDHLLIGQDGGALGAPVDERLLAVGQAAPEHLEKEPLVPAVILRLTSGDFALPIVTKGKAAVSLFHRLDVAQGPLARRLFVGDGGVFGGQAEGVPTHWMQDVKTAHPFVAGQRVADRIISDVADVERAAGIGQHLQHIELRFGGILFRAVEIGVLPALVPLQFYLRVVVRLFGHNSCSSGDKAYGSRRRNG